MSNSKFYYAIEDDTQWFVVIDDKNAKNDFSYSALFDKSLNVANQTFVFIDRSEIGRRKETLKKKNSSISYSSQKGTTQKGIDFVIFVIYPYQLNDSNKKLIMEKLEYNVLP